MKGRSRVVLALVLGGMSLAGGSARAQDDDEREDRLARGRIVLKNACLMCHSPEIIDSQRLSPEQWKAELVKMVGWGAPLAEDDRPILLDLLNATRGPKVAREAPPRVAKSDGAAAIAPRAGATPGDASRGDRLYATHCASCHGADARGIDGGINLLARPVLDRAEDYRSVVREGRNKMPGFRSVLDEAKEGDILAWIRQRSR